MDAALGDLDGDGDLDAFVSNASLLLLGQANTVWLNQILVDLGITKSVAPDGDLNRDDAITYTLVYSNAGPLTATGVVISDLAPIPTVTNVSFVSSGALVTPSGSLSYTWQVQDLPPDAGGVITIFGRISPTDSGSFNLTNQATITAAEIDVNSDNNQASATSAIVERVVDLGITKSVRPAGDLTPDDIIIYTLIYLNSGPMIATGVVITDLVPIPTVTNVSFISSGALVTPTGSLSYTWQVQDLSPGEGGIITIFGRINSTVSGLFSLTNRAAIIAAERDANDDNNQASVSSTIVGTAVDLSITKSVLPTGVLAPDNAITYTLTYSNIGLSAATSVVITDIVPIPTVTNVSFVSSGALVTPSGSLSYTWQVQDLPPDAGGVITIFGRISLTDSGGFNLTNQATITAAEIDVNSDNNQASVSSQVAYQPVYPSRLYLPVILKY
jgi:uncharacterized repeat protein (TIGR01451 family)